MANGYKIFGKIKILQLIIVVLIILLIFLAAFLFHWHQASDSINKYLIENKYYGFKLQTPKSWIAEGMTVLYSEDNVGKILAECKNDKLDGTSVYEIGRFRFESQVYPPGSVDTGSFSGGFPSGVILDIKVGCIPDGMDGKILSGNYGNLQVGGEKAFGAFINILGIGETKSISLLHNNLQYRISEYTYISSTDKSSEENLRGNYSGKFDGIISSFKFTK
jgi:hypothetical protein